MLSYQKAERGNKIADFIDFYLKFRGQEYNCGEIQKIGEMQKKYREIQKIYIDTNF